MDDLKIFIALTMKMLLTHDFRMFSMTVDK